MSNCPFEYYEMLQPKFVELFPEQIQSYNIPVTNFGSPNKKRVRVWPFTINTFGVNVTFTPEVDCVNTPASTFNTNCKTTVFHHFTTDVFGINYGGFFDGSSPFELWQVHDPTLVQVLPIAKRFDQIGPEELFEYTKIRAFDIRVIAFGGSIIPYTIYFEDVSVKTDNIVVVDGKEGTYRISLPKTIAGTDLRIEFGPTNFDFHRWYTRIQAMMQGRINTENQWLTLGAESEKQGQ